MSLPSSLLGRWAPHAIFLVSGLWAGSSLAAPSVAPPPDLSQMSAMPLTAAPTKPPAPTPVVQRNVIEDDGSRIEETRVRGQVQRITVTPKIGSKASYEILPGDGSGSESSRSSAGKRVWNVLQF
jgi:Protein of unknown function (DUF2782)